MIEIRSCTGFDEFQGCVQLQIETWGYDESDVIPRKVFRVAQKIGGQVLGAFDPEISSTEPGKGAQALVGFVMSLPGVKTGVPSDRGSQETPFGFLGWSDRSSSLGWKAGAGEPRPYLHSHMLAVREGYRNRGLGAQLKRQQRLEALSRGIRLMEWTFDPLEIKNAFLNIHRLGATVSTYLVDFYGVSSSRLQGGLPTDRLVAEWRLDSERVEAILDGRPPEPLVIEERILVPAAISAWKASEDGRHRAHAVQLENRHKFQQAFSQGLAVVGFTRDSQGNGIFEMGRVPGA